MHPSLPVRRHALPAALLLALLGAPLLSSAAEADLAAIQRSVTAQHDVSLKRLQDWIALPSIAAENLNSREGADYMATLAREAGFQKVEILDTDGKIIKVKACTSCMSAGKIHRAPRGVPSVA